MTQLITSEPALTVKTEEDMAFLFDAIDGFKEIRGNWLRIRVNLNRADTNYGIVTQRFEVRGQASSEPDQERPMPAWPSFWCQLRGITDTHHGTDAMLETRKVDYEQLASQADPREASTTPTGRAQEELKRIAKYKIERHIGGIFRTGEDEHFEDGMYSNFSRELLKAVEEYGIAAMSEIAYLIIYDRVGHGVASEALRWLGRISDVKTYGWRLWLLEKSLYSRSYLVRDGAVLGLASMGDTAAVPYLREAANRETIDGLREDMQQALEELEALLDATSAQSDQEE